MKDLDLDLKLHLDQFKSFHRLLLRTCSNRKVKLNDVSKRLNIIVLS